jgi:hypothetical protein
MYHFLLDVKPTTFVDAWKAISIGFTGAFGILGLATEFRNKRTHKINPWGWFSLTGIVLSTVLGIAAQLNETKQTNADAAETRKLLEPLGDLDVRIEFSVSCYGNVPFRSVCENEERPRAHFGEVRPASDFGPVMASLSFYKDAKTVQDCLGTNLTCGSAYLYIDVVGDATALLREGGELRVRVPKMAVINRRAPSQELVSIMDLPGSAVILHIGDDTYGQMGLRSIAVDLKDGREFPAWAPYRVTKSEPKYFLGVLTK